jgi:2-polyprenyl-3-methyl-5-hydroxy-6-metoxy-1,4-benzoquinol methylase
VDEILSLQGCLEALDIELNGDKNMEKSPYLRKIDFSSKRIEESDKGNRLWNWMAFSYEQFFSQFPPYQHLLRKIVKLAGDPGSSKVLLLDAGCGPGLMSIELAKRGYWVLGIDRSPEMLKRAQRKKERENLDHVSFRKGDLNLSLHELKNSFQKILLIHSLYALDNPEETLREISSALMEKGELFMCNPSRRFTWIELLGGGWSFMRQALHEKGLFSFFFFLSIAIAMGGIHSVIQYRKKKVYHCWNEKEIEDLVKTSGLRLKWINKSCMNESHLLLCAVKDG